MKDKVELWFALNYFRKLIDNYLLIDMYFPLINKLLGPEGKKLLLCELYNLPDSALKE